MKIVCALLLVVVFDGLMCQDSAVFIQEEMCDLEGSINRGCSIEVGDAHNIMDCVRMCWPDTDCVGAGMDLQGRCVHHRLCHSTVQCHEGSDDRSRHRYMAPYCRHGTWDAATKSCSCLYETFGERCNKYHKSCEILKDPKYAPNLYWIILDPLENGSNRLKVMCRKLRSGNYYMRMFMNSGGVHFNQSWTEYVNGFFIDKDNFWLGLRALNIFTGLGYTRADLVLDFTNFFLAVRYKSFVTAGEGGNYSFTLEYFTTLNSGEYELGDCLSPLQGVPFSTWDRHQDGDNIRGENCASRAGSGWWYKDNCDNPCQILGWGKNDYAGTPYPQRLTALGVDMSGLVDSIADTYIQLSCSDQC